MIVARERKMEELLKAREEIKPCGKSVKWSQLETDALVNAISITSYFSDGMDHTSAPFFTAVFILFKCCSQPFSFMYRDARKKVNLKYNQIIKDLF